MEGRRQPGSGGLWGASIERILDALAEAVTVTEVDGRLLFANAAALERMGVKSLQEAIAAGPDEVLARFDLRDEEGRPLRPDELPGRRLLRGEPAPAMLLRMIDRASGRARWTLVKATALQADDGRQVAVNVLEDITETKEQELRERFLAHAGEVLASSLDYEETLTQVTRLAVPDLADWCSIELLQDGEIQQVAVAHVDPERVTFARELRRRFPPRLEDRFGVGAVLRTGRGEHHPSIPDELLVQRAADPEHLRILREVQMRSAMIAPLRVRGRVIGAISFVATDLAGAYDEEDFAFAQAFASRAAVAVENARLYCERSETAEMLQRSLLPSGLPEVPGWTLASRYQPAAAGGELIGGDFFDVFPATGGFVAMLGDVTGKGIAAAALTALTRHSARAAALLGLSPAQILALLNRLLLSQGELSLVTAVVAQVQGTSVTVASGGHPLPLLRRGEGAPAELGRAGVLLGFDPDGEWPEVSLALEPGDTLLLYTDGVIDTRRGAERFGERRLLDALAHSPAEPHGLLEELQARLRSFASGGTRDDVALLAARCSGGPSVALQAHRPMARVLADDQHRGAGAADQLLGEVPEQQPTGATAAVMSADDQIDAVLVGVGEQRRPRILGVDDLLARLDPGPVGAVGDLAKALPQVLAGRLLGLPAIAGRLGAGGRMGDRYRHQLALAAAGQVDGHLEGAQRHLRAVPGEHDPLEHQRSTGISTSATTSAAIT